MQLRDQPDPTAREQWWLFPCKPYLRRAFARRRREVKQLLGYIYLSHHTGWTWQLCYGVTDDPDGRLKLTGNQRQLGLALVYSHGFTSQCLRAHRRLGGAELLHDQLRAQGDRAGTVAGRPLTDPERDWLGLPEQPEWVALHRCPEVEATRSWHELDPWREADNPDWLEVLLIPSETTEHTESLPALIEGTLADGRLICRLLDEPEQPLGFRYGDLVLVGLWSRNGALHPCVEAHYQSQPRGRSSGPRTRT